MRKLIYTYGVSLDGYINDRDGSIDWTDPDEELHQFHNDRFRELEISLHGRRLYELMAEYWPHVPEDASRIEHESPNSGRRSPRSSSLGRSPKSIGTAP